MRHVTHILLAAVICIGISMGSGVCTAAAAIVTFGAPITFDQDGLGTGIVVDTFNFLPGNALAIGAVPAFTNFVNSAGTLVTPFDSILQTSLGSIQYVGGNGAPISLNAGTEITLVLRTRQQPSNPTSSVFSTGTPNFLNLYYDPTQDVSNLFGTGFNNGRLILSAAVMALGSTVTVGGPAGFLDANAPNDYPGITTLAQNGTANFTASVLFFDPDFFITGPTAVTFATALIAPFPGGVGGIDPSAMLDGTPVNVGSVNGQSGPDILFRSQSELTFAVAAVPEPSTLSLLALGALFLFAWVGGFSYPVAQDGRLARGVHAGILR